MLFNLDVLRGYGVVIVIAAFSIQMISFGTARSIAVYNVEFLRSFNTTAFQVSLIGSINLGLFLGAGPVSSVLMSSMSHRQVALIGAILSNIGIFCMPFAPNIPYMYVFYGILAGLGYALVYIPSHVLSGLYYGKHKSVSTGIVSGGLGCGNVAFPILVNQLIHQYGWRGSFLLLSGINLHLFVFVALLRPLPSEVLHEIEIPIELNNDDEKVKHPVDHSSPDTNMTFDHSDYFSPADSERELESEPHKRLLNGYVEQQTILCGEDRDLKLIKENNAVGELKPLLDATTDIHNEQCTLNDGRKHIVLVEDKFVTYSGNDVLNDNVIDMHNVKNRSGANNLPVNEISKVNDLQANGPAYEIYVHTFTACSNVLKTTTLHDAAHTIQDETKLGFCKSFCTNIRPLINIDFVVYCISNIFWNAGVMALVLFLSDYMISIGMTRDDAAIGLSLYGAGTIIGSILVGFIGNLKHINRYILYIFGNIGSGLVAFLFVLPLFQSRTGQFVLAIMFGYMYGNIIGLLVAVTDDILGSAALGNGLGCVMLCNGIGVFSGPPIAGILIDRLGTQYPGIFIAGTLTVMGGLVMCFVPVHQYIIYKSDKGDKRLRH